jgi:hypothetical protein
LPTFANPIANVAPISAVRANTIDRLKSTQVGQVAASHGPFGKRELGGTTMSAASLRGIVSCPASNTAVAATAERAGSGG